MRFGTVVAATSGFLSVGLLALCTQHPGTSHAESERAKRPNSLNQVDSRQFSTRASLSTSFRDPVVSSVVAQFEKNAKQGVDADGTFGTASNSALMEEIHSLREEKETLEAQHVALVKQLRELRIELSKSRAAPDSSDLLTELDTARRLRRQVEVELDVAKEKLVEQQKEIAAASSAKGFTSSELTECKSQIEQNERIVSRLPEIHEKFYALKQEVGKKQDALTQCSSDLGTLKEKNDRIPTLKQELAKKEAELQEYKSTVAKQKKEIDSIPMLKQQLIATKNELLMKETELKVLSGAADAKKLEAIAKAKTQASSSASKTQTPATSATPVASDMLIVEVTGSKVNLRSGPGTEHSPVMQVQRKTRLTVEDKQGDWYRVFTPTGSRAYVSADTVRELNAGTAASDSATQASKRKSNNIERNSPVARALKANDAAAALKAASKDDTLVPFGVVDLSSSARKTRDEKRALRILKKGVGKPNKPPVPPAAGE